jgi:hypothetical protein
MIDPMRYALIAALLLAAGPAWTQDEKEEPKKPDVQPVDLAKVLRGSKEFKEKLKSFRMSFDEGVVRAVGEIVYRGGGPCEYLVNVFPQKAHETIVLLDNGPWEGEGRRDRKFAQGLATTLNNAMIAAGFEKGKPFDWDRETGEVFPPKGDVVHIYCEWKENDKVKRAAMSDWLWNYKLLDVMKPGHWVYTGSTMIDEGPPDHKLWFGAEIDGLLVAVLNTSTAMIDNTEDGALENGAYEAIHHRIPEIGTRVTVVFSKKKLECHEYEPLEIPEETLKERKRRQEERAKAEAEKKNDEADKEKDEAPDK